VRSRLRRAAAARSCARDSRRSSRPNPRASAAASCRCASIGGPRRGRRIFDALGDHGIVCDWREPDIIRIAPARSYNRFIDIFELVEELAAALKEIA
jgi:kynureninase